LEQLGAIHNSSIIRRDLHSRQPHLGALMRPVSLPTGAWRFPGANSII
jgi:hypothetical protein